MIVGIKLRNIDNDWSKEALAISKYATTRLLIGTIDKRMEDIDILITTSLSMDELELLPNLRAVFAFKTGLDGFPISQLDDRGIYVRASHINADLVAEHAVALSLSLLHRVVEFHNDLLQGMWYSDGKHYMWKSIRSIKIGIIGYGHIGRQIYNILSKINSSIVVFNRSANYFNGEQSAKSIDDVIAFSELVFLCLPYTESTKGILSRERLMSAKGKYIVNVGRAQIIDECALYELLSDGTISGYASDVWSQAPDKSDKAKPHPPSSLPFGKLKNVILSPHCATHEPSAHKKYVKDTAQACIKYILDNNN